MFWCFGGAVVTPPCNWGSKSLEGSGGGGKRLDRGWAATPFWGARAIGAWSYWSSQKRCMVLVEYLTGLEYGGSGWRVDG